MAKKTAPAALKVPAGADDDATDVATVEQPAGNRRASEDQGLGLPEAGSAIDAYLSLGGNENRDTVTVFKASDTGAPVFLFSADPTDVPPDALMQRLRRDYGPGEYRLQVRKGGRIAENKRIGVEAEPVRNVYEREPQQEARRNEPDWFTKMMMDQAARAQESQTKLLAALIGRPVQDRPGMDVAKVLGVATPLLLPFINGIIEQMKGARPDMLEMAQKLATLRETLAGDDAPAPASGKGFIDLLSDVARSMGPAFGQMMLRAQAQSASTPAATAAAPVSAPAIAGPGEGGQPAPVTKTEAPPVVVAQQLPAGHPLEVLLKMLVTAAVKDSDVVAYSEMVIDQWPFGGEEGLISGLQDPRWLDALANFNPDVRAHAPWFERLRDAILERFEPEAPEADADKG